MKLLCVLAERPDDVVGRDELMETLWPRVVVNENSLTRAISDLRRLLEDGTGRPFITTVPKRGYKLVASVAVTESTTDGNDDAAGIDPGTSRHRRPRTIRLASVSAVLAMGLLGVMGLSLVAGPAKESPGNPAMITDDRHDPLPTESNGDIVRRDGMRSPVPAITTSGAPESDPDMTGSGIAISPGGELVAFTRMTDEGSTLMIGSLQDNSDPLQVYTSRHRIDHLYWSPVGHALLFSVLPTVSHAAIGEGGNGQLMLFDLRDLSVRELYRSQQNSEETPARFNDALNIT